MEYKIRQFVNCIKRIDTDNQTTEVNSIPAGWTIHYSSVPWLKPILESLKRGDTYKVSRHDILSTVDKRARLIKVLFWGYPKAFRDNQYLGNILNNTDTIIETLPNYKTRLNHDDFINLYNNIASVNGIQQSTLSKILCFWEISAASSQSVIVDRFVLESSHLFYELWDLRLVNSSATDYLSAVKKINRMAREMSVHPQQLELFLFKIGKIVKENRQSLFKQLLLFVNGSGFENSDFIE